MNKKYLHLLWIIPVVIVGIYQLVVVDIEFMEAFEILKERHNDERLYYASYPPSPFDLSRIIETFKNPKKRTLICSGTDYIKLVERFCYSIHNPRSDADYTESWGSAYRMCLRQNLNLGEQIFDEDCSNLFDSIPHIEIK